MSEPPETRQSLILRLRHPDDAEAWQEFVEIYQPLVFRLARGRGLQEADALDTTQEVLARVADAINRWDPDPQRGSFRGWISRIARNIVIDHLRVRAKSPLTSDDSAIDELVRSKPDRSTEIELFDLEHQRQVFAWAAEKIKPTFQPNSWQAFWLTAVEHHSVESVGKQLGLSNGAVYIARSRVMAKLKQQVQEHLYSNQPDAQSLDPSPTFIKRSET